MNDERAIAAVSAGDHVALRELFDRHAPWVARRLGRVLPVDAVEDVLQETFIAVWKGAGRYHGGGDAGAWIWGIARRQAALWTRKHGRTEPVWDASESDDPAMQAVNNADLERALAALGPEGSEQRRLARLVFIEDRPLAEVSQTLGIPVGAVEHVAIGKETNQLLVEIDEESEGILPHPDAQRYGSYELGDAIKAHGVAAVINALVTMNANRVPRSTLQDIADGTRVKPSVARTILTALDACGPVVGCCDLARTKHRK